MASSTPFYKMVRVSRSYDAESLRKKKFGTGNMWVLIEKPQGVHTKQNRKEFSDAVKDYITLRHGEEVFLTDWDRDKTRLQEVAREMMKTKLGEGLIRVLPDTTLGTPSILEMLSILIFKQEKSLRSNISSTMAKHGYQGEPNRNFYKKKRARSNSSTPITPLAPVETERNLDISEPDAEGEPDVDVQCFHLEAPCMDRRSGSATRGGPAEPSGTAQLGWTVASGASSGDVSGRTAPFLPESSHCAGTRSNELSRMTPHTAALDRQSWQTPMRQHSQYDQSLTEACPTYAPLAESEAERVTIHQLVKLEAVSNHVIEFKDWNIDNLRSVPFHDAKNDILSAFGPGYENCWMLQVVHGPCTISSKRFWADNAMEFYVAVSEISFQLEMERERASVSGQPMIVRLYATYPAPGNWPS